MGINHLLEQFYTYEKKHPGLTKGSVSFDFKKHSGHIAFGSIIHGNETGSLPEVLRVIDALSNKKIHYGGRVSFFLGNIEAAKQNKRYIESDLNRAFGEVFPGSVTQERKRALELTRILDEADVFIDFHQTMRKSLKPFYVFAMHNPSYYWARAAGMASIFVTRKPGKKFSSAGMCSDEYMRSLGKPGITIELGEQGVNDKASIITHHIF